MCNISTAPYKGGFYVPRLCHLNTKSPRYLPDSFLVSIYTDLLNSLLKLLTVDNKRSIIELPHKEVAHNDPKTMRTKIRTTNIRSSKGISGPVLRDTRTDHDQTDRGKIQAGSGQSKRPSKGQLTSDNQAKVVRNMKAKTDPKSGTILKQILDDKGIKRPWLANKVGVSASYIYQIQAGKRPVSKQVADKIAEALDLPIKVVFPDVVISKRHPSFKD